ncbi:DUF4276 family protein [Pseudomonas gingeri]|uniref:DUF4276 family protein n=1 Tax=Pseudomonas gingeri TaxID=117681 RepID=UPI0015A48E1B|nr:DUF4276 family protein [Pseudomonas gingeri]NWE46708.1 hypothetical protein [Pseudomonas gingeri]
MHIEIVVEDSSGERLLSTILPKIFGGYGDPHTWRVHAYKGIGRIPKNMKANSDPSKRILLDQLPRILQGYGRTPGIDAVVVVLDTDKRDCREFLAELNALAEDCSPRPNLMFRLAIEEVEAWYLGDRQALLDAYPRAKTDVLGRYVQDSPCDTWELLADAVYPGGVSAIKKVGWPLPGQIKHEWAEKIGPLLELDRNVSPSFCKLRDGLRRLVVGGS